MKLKYLLKLVGTIQLVLGLFYLFAPQLFLHLLGHSPVAADVLYPLGMLSARFIAYGFGLFYIAKNPSANSYWVSNMLLIQLIDLAVGIFYTATGVLPLSISGFPMFNAVWISILLWLWHPAKTIND